MCRVINLLAPEVPRIEAHLDSIVVRMSHGERTDVYSMSC